MSSLRLDIIRVRAHDISHSQRPRWPLYHQCGKVVQFLLHHFYRSTIFGVRKHSFYNNTIHEIFKQMKYDCKPDIKYQDYDLSTICQTQVELNQQQYHHCMHLFPPILLSRFHVLYKYDQHVHRQYTVYHEPIHCL